MLFKKTSTSDAKVYREKEMRKTAWEVLKKRIVEKGLEL